MRRQGKKERGNGEGDDKQRKEEKKEKMDA